MTHFISSIVSRLGIYLLLGLSRLPLWFWYGVSDILYIVFYKLIKYRVKVVRDNLQNSFPEKAISELRHIEKQYYRYLADLVVETVKGFTISKEELFKRIKAETHIYDELFEKGQNAIVVMGHNGNWEWISRSSQLIYKHQILVAYKPLSNPYFDRLLYKTRTAFGAQLVPMSQVARVLLQQQKPYLLILVADQSPSDKKSSIWVRFLNQETAVLPGVEKLATKFKLPVIFHEVKRIKRGFYQCFDAFLVKAGEMHPPGEITAIHTGYLEEKIREQPETWLWSHKRWKLKND